MSKRPGDAEYNAAIDALKSTLAVRPNSALAHLLLADAYRAEGRYSEALRLLEYCIKVDPSSKDAHLLAGKVYQKLGNKSLALKYFKQYEVLNPDDNNVKQTIKSLESK
jgi:tetratricopeptide (TPR) repeat protein